MYLSLKEIVPRQVMGNKLNLRVGVSKERQTKKIFKKKITLKYDSVTLANVDQRHRKRYVEVKKENNRVDIWEKQHLLKFIPTYYVLIKRCYFYLP